jgi:hypothetical protein
LIRLRHSWKQVKLCLLVPYILLPSVLFSFLLQTICQQLHENSVDNIELSTTTMSLRSFALLGLAASALAGEPKVLHMPMARNPNANPLAKRDTASVTVTNALSQGIYFVNATVGTPGQLVQLVLDTGSSDIWFFGPNSCNAKTSDCLGGTCTFFLLTFRCHVVAWHVDVQIFFRANS